MPAKKPKNTTGTIDKTPAQLEAERRYDSSSYTSPKAKGLGDQLLDAFGNAQKNQQEADLEAQRRYDSSSTLPEDARYKAPISTSSALKNAAPGLKPSGGAPNSGGEPVGSRSSGGSSGGGGVEVPAVPTLEEQLAAIQAMTGTIDPSLRQYVPTEGKLALMYGQFDQAINKNRADLTKSYDESINAIKGNYAQSNNLLNAAAGKDQAVLQQAAQNLGVGGEYAASPVNQNLSEALNRFTGTNAGNQAIDLSYFEKLKNLDDTNLTNWLAVSQRDKQNAIQDSSNRMQELQQMANEQARALATQQLMTDLAALGGGGGSGGGGGGRRGGRGGSGGSRSPASSYANIVENAELTGELDYVGLQETIASLPPNLQQLAIDYIVKGGSPEGGAQKVLAAMEAMGPVGLGSGFGVTLPGYVDPRDNSPYVKPGSYTSRTNTGLNSNQLNQIYQALLGYVPGLAPIETAQTTDASRRTTKSYDDTQYIPPKNPTGPGLFGLNPSAPAPKPKRPSLSGLNKAAGRRVKVV